MSDHLLYLFFSTLFALLGMSMYVLGAFIFSRFHKPQAENWWWERSNLSTFSWVSLLRCSCPTTAQLTSLSFCEHRLASVALPGSWPCFLHTGRQIRKLIDQLLSLNGYVKFKSVERLLLRNRNNIFDGCIRNAVLVNIYILVHFYFEINIYLIKIHVSKFEVIKLKSIRTF